MKIARFWDPVENAARFGVVEGEVVFDVEGSVFDDKIKVGRGSRPLKGLRLLAPCTPTKIIMGGLNYVGHAKETGAAIPKVPGVLQKPVNTLIDPRTRPRPGLAWPRAAAVRCLPDAGRGYARQQSQAQRVKRQ